MLDDADSKSSPASPVQCQRAKVQPIFEARDVAHLYRVSKQRGSKVTRLLTLISECLEDAHLHAAIASHLDISDCLNDGI